MSWLHTVALIKLSNQKQLREKSWIVASGSRLRSSSQKAGKAVTQAGPRSISEHTAKDVLQKKLRNAVDGLCTGSCFPIRPMTSCPENGVTIVSWALLQQSIKDNPLQTRPRPIKSSKFLRRFLGDFCGLKLTVKLGQRDHLWFYKGTMVPHRGPIL